MLTMEGGPPWVTCLALTSTCLSPRIARLDMLAEHLESIFRNAEVNEIRARLRLEFVVRPFGHADQIAAAHDGTVRVDAAPLHDVHRIFPHVLVIGEHGTG